MHKINQTIGDPNYGDIELVPCPFCANVPTFSDAVSKEDNRYIEMTLRCCLSMSTSLSFDTFKSMSSTEINEKLQADLIQKWSTRSSGASADSEVHLSPPRPMVMEATNPWEAGSRGTELNPGLVGRWRVIPLAFGDGTVIMTEDTQKTLLHLSDYSTTQYLTALHNASIDACMTHQSPDYRKEILSLDIKRDMSGAVEFRKAVERILNSGPRLTKVESDRPMAEIIAALRDTSDDSLLAFSAKEMRTVLNASKDDKATGEGRTPTASPLPKDVGDCVAALEAAWEGTSENALVQKDRQRGARAALALTLDILAGPTDTPPTESSQ